MEKCEICGKTVKNFEYEKCCDGIGCDCKGEVLGVCLCSEECAEVFDELKTYQDKIFKLQLENRRLEKKLEKIYEILPTLEEMEKEG